MVNYLAHLEVFKEEAFENGNAYYIIDSKTGGSQYKWRGLMMKCALVNTKYGYLISCARCKLEKECEILNAFDRLHKRSIEQEKLIEEYEANRVREFNYASYTHCVYCGGFVKSAITTKEALINHAKQCTKHPIYIANTKLENIESLIKQMLDEFKNGDSTQSFEILLDTLKTLQKISSITKEN